MKWSTICVFCEGGAALTHHWAVPSNIEVKILLTSATVRCIFVYQQLSSMIPHISPEDQTHALSTPTLRRLVSGAN